MRIREIREAKGLQQKVLARNLGIKPNRLSQYETGAREPDLDTLDRIATELDVSVDALMGREDRQEKPTSVSEDGLTVFAERLKALRKGRGITQAQFSENFNISRGTIGMWETGRREPDFETAIRIADYFHVSVDYLIGRDEKEKPTPEAGGGLNEADLRLVALHRSLNREGQEQLFDYANYLISTGKYIKSDSVGLGKEA